ncbi:hypothetical protein ACFLRH_00780 [Actinomycetota bacterium]
MASTSPRRGEFGSRHLQQFAGLEQLGNAEVGTACQHLDTYSKRLGEMLGGWHNNKGPPGCPPGGVDEVLTG